MKVLELCDIYFLGLVVIQGIVLILIDVRSFEKKNMKGTAVKCKRIGSVVVVIGIILFIANNFVSQ